eukprot:158754-Amphidinium_carterae.1
MYATTSLRATKWHSSEADQRQALVGAGVQVSKLARSSPTIVAPGEVEQATLCWVCKRGATEELTRLVTHDCAPPGSHCSWGPSVLSARLEEPQVTSTMMGSLLSGSHPRDTSQYTPWCAATDARSLHDAIQQSNPSTAEKRVLVDLAAIRQAVAEVSDVFPWLPRKISSMALQSHGQTSRKLTLRARQTVLARSSPRTTPVLTCCLPADSLLRNMGITCWLALQLILGSIGLLDCDDSRACKESGRSDSCILCASSSTACFHT